MIKNTLLSCVLYFSCLFISAFADLNSPYDSACVVYSYGEVNPMTQQREIRGGSGCTFAEDKDHLYILTAGHVVQTDKKIALKYYNDDFESIVVYGEVCFVKWNDKPEDGLLDVAILKVKKTGFSGYPLPKIIPLADKDPNIGDVVYNCGSTGTNWPSCVRMKVVHKVSGHFKLSGPQYPGRSGSAILDKSCDRIVGICVLSDGKCISIEKIRADIAGWDAVKTPEVKK